MQKNLVFRVLALVMCLLVVLSAFTACSDEDTAADVITDEAAAYTPEWTVKPEISAQLIRPLTHANFNENTNHYDISYAECFLIMVNGKYGIISIDGEMLIEAEYDEIFAIRDGNDFLAVKETEDGRKQTYIHSDTFKTQEANKKYNTVKYEYCWNVKTGTPFFICNDNGNITKETFSPVLPEAVKGVNGETGSSVPNGKYGLFSNGDNITDMIYTNAGQYNDGLIAFESNGKWGYLDSDGSTVIPFLYDAIWGYNALGGKDTPYESFEGCITVSKDKKFGVLSSAGAEIVPLIFEDATPVVNGKAFVKSEGKWGVIEIFDNSASVPVVNGSENPFSESTSSTSSETSTTTTTTTTTSTTEPSTSTTTTTTTTTTTEPSEQYGTGNYRLTGDVNFRAEPNKDSEWIGIGKAGRAYYVIEVENGWGKTEFNGQECWFYLGNAKLV